MANSGDMPIGIHACLRRYIYIHECMSSYMLVCFFIFILIFRLTVAHCVLTLRSDHSSETPFHQQFSRSSSQYIPHWMMKQWKDQQNHSWINNRDMFNLSQIESTTIFFPEFLQIQPYTHHALVRQWWCSVADSPKISTGEILAPSIERLGLHSPWILQWWSWNAFGCHGPWVYIKRRIFIMEIYQVDIVQHISCNKVWMYGMYPCCPYF